MKNKNIILVVLALFVSTNLFVACNKNLDINVDPNSPTDVPENLMLSALLANFSYEVIGGYPVRTTGLWTKHIASATDGPHEGNYWITTSDVNNIWTSFSYTDVMNNAYLLKNKAAENGNPHYSAIAKIVLAWNMSIVTDLFGDAPFSEAFRGQEGILKPKYDTQEEIYTQIQTLLDEAIAESAATENNLKPSNDDFVYAGDMTKWKNLAHTLKARFFLRLSNAPGYTAATQAELALNELAKGAITQATQPKFNYLATTGSENPWYQYAIDGKWNTTTRPSQYYVNKLIASNDPRLAFQADTVKTGTNVDSVNVGKYIGVVNESPANPIVNFSALGSFYSAKDAPLYWLVYPEVEFIKAEAEFLKSNKSVTESVKAAYAKAVEASMNFYGIDSDEANTYLAANALNGNAAVAYEQIMTEKYIANYLQFESYNDFRRTGYPVLPINNEIYPDGTLDQAPRLQQIPVRFPYPSGERQYNNANIPASIPTEPLQAMVIPVWWNSK